MQQSVRKRQFLLCLIAFGVCGLLLFIYLQYPAPFILGGFEFVLSGVFSWAGPNAFCSRCHHT